MTNCVDVLFKGVLDLLAKYFTISRNPIPFLTELAFVIIAAHHVLHTTLTSSQIIFLEFYKNLNYQG